MTELVERNYEPEILPTSWAGCSLGDVVEFSKAKAEPHEINSETPYIGLEHIEKHSGYLLRHGTSAEVRSTKSRFYGGELLYGKLRPYLNKVYVAEFDGVCSTDILVLKTMNEVDSRYLRYRLLSPDFVHYANQNVSGVQHPRVNAKTVGQFDIGLPPPNEQRRIVEKIEELFTRLGAGVEALKYAQAQLKKYRQSVLNAAVTGELSREWREAHAGELEPASELLERVLEERREKWTGKNYKEPVRPDGTKFFDLPESWIQTTLDQVLREPMGNGLSVRGSDSPPGIASLKLNALRADGLDFNQVRYLSVEDSKVANLWVQEGDFFIVRGNGTLPLVGRGGIAQTPPFPAIFPDTMIRARLVDAACSTGWLSTVWQSHIVRHQIEAKAKTSAGIWKVSQSDLKSVVYPLPPLEEQRFIVTEVERRFSVIDQLETTIEESLRRSGSLRQSILKRAFSGRLVEQDPDDEPASVLLERIREEQRSEGRKPKKRRSEKATDDGTLF